MLVHSTHATLLARLSGGSDPAAWDDFCARYGELIRSFARRQGLQPSDCDDILQDVLLALNKSMPGFEYDPSRGKFRSYLKTAALHAIFRRSHQKRGEVHLEEVASAVHEASADSSIDQQWESEWRQHHLRRAMRTIDSEFNEADRTAFQLYGVEGRPAAETAGLLQMSVDQVYQAKSRVLKRLGELIDQQVREEG